MTTILRDDRLEEVRGQLAAAQALPKVQVELPRHGVFSGNNQLGIELPFKPNAVHPQTIFKMDEWGFPQAWTISLGVRLEHELGDREAFDCVGQILIGSGGIQQAFEVDWVDGTMFSVVGNAINVVARLNDLQQVSGIPAPNGVNVSVQVGQYAAGQTRATVTRFQNLLASTLSGIGRIPTFAKSVQVLPIRDTDPAVVYSAGMLLQFFANQVGTPNPVATIPGNFLAPGVKVPIPAIARYFAMRNTGLADAQASAIFNLFHE